MPLEVTMPIDQRFAEACVKAQERVMAAKERLAIAKRELAAATRALGIANAEMELAERHYYQQPDRDSEVKP